MIHKKRKMGIVIQGSNGGPVPRSLLGIVTWIRDPFATIHEMVTNYAKKNRKVGILISTETFRFKNKQGFHLSNSSLFLPDILRKPTNYIQLMLAFTENIV